MSYDTWKCSPPDEEFETEACGHIVGTCVCDEAPVEEDGGIVAEVEITLGDIDQLQAFLEEHGELPRHGVEDGLLALARKALVRCVLHAGPDADADPDGLTYANAPTYAAEAERRRVVELERRDEGARGGGMTTPVPNLDDIESKAKAALAFQPEPPSDGWPGGEPETAPEWDATSGWIEEGGHAAFGRQHEYSDDQESDGADVDAAYIKALDPTTVLALVAECRELRELQTVRHIDEWHEDFGAVLWWKQPVNEPPYCGTPLDSDWPGYHEHWSPVPVREGT